MKNHRRWLLLLLFCGGIAFFIVMRRGEERTTTNEIVADGVQTESMRSNEVATAPEKQLPNRLPTIDPAEQYRQKMLRPITFFGKVVDEEGRPVPGARASLEWSDMTENGASTRELFTDTNGLFSISGARGKGLDVRVSKDGYYPVTRSNQIAFEYADEFDRRFHRPDLNNPVLFYLRKRGQGSELLTSEKGMRSVLGIELPTNGEPVRIDLWSQAKSPNGQIELSAKKERKDRDTGRNDWTFHLRVPSGGVVEHNQEFPFEAPESGYKPELEWSFTKNDPNWQANLQKDFFVTFGSPPRYGRIHIETSAFQSAVFLEYAVNPTGSRNLEIGPAEMRAKQTQFE